MSNETPPKSDANRESEIESPPGTTLTRLSDRLLSERDYAGERNRRLVAVIGLLSLLTVFTGTSLDVLANLPFDPQPVPASLRGAVAVTTPVVLGLALIALAVVAERGTLRVGGVFAGVFGLLPMLSDAATIPAVLGVIVGGGVMLFGAVSWPSSYRAARRQLLGAVVVAGITLSLSASVGLLNGTIRGLGGILTLGAATGLVVMVDRERMAVLAGAVAFLATIAVSVAQPYVVGSVLLVAFAAAGVPHLFVAGAVGGVTAATVAGLRQRSYPLAVGAPLIALAGVPATFPRAMAVVLGATLALSEFQSGSTTDSAPTEVRR
jgi:hypothetical protein